MRVQHVSLCSPKKKKKKPGPVLSRVSAKQQLFNWSSAQALQSIIFAAPFLRETRTRQEERTFRDERLLQAAGCSSPPSAPVGAARGWGTHRRCKGDGNPPALHRVRATPGSGLWAQKCPVLLHLLPLPFLSCCCCRSEISGHAVAAGCRLSWLKPRLWEHPQPIPVSSVALPPRGLARRGGARLGFPVPHPGS